MSLATNYVDAVLDTSQNTKRKYTMTTNSDDTVSFDDATEYTTEGSTFGAGDINATNGVVNNVSSRTCTNIINPTLTTATTKNGITCTPNGDGTYTLNGTATANTYFTIFSKSDFSEGSCKITGCPSGGSNSTYCCEANYLEDDEIVNTLGTDTGSGATFDGTNDNEYVFAYMIYIKSRTSLSNKVFKPMLTTDTQATYSDFVQYSGDGEINDNVSWLYRNFSNALTSLKNTAIAQAVGATGSTFASVIATLGNIVNRGAVSQSITANTTTQTYTVPEGYHNGSGVVTVSPQQHSDTYSVTSNGTTDMGESHNYRYVSVSADVTHTIQPYLRINDNIYRRAYVGLVVDGVDKGMVEIGNAGDTALQNLYYYGSTFTV